MIKIILIIIMATWLCIDIYKMIAELIAKRKMKKVFLEIQQKGDNN